MIDLTADHRRALRAHAHSLKPVVYVAEQGLSASVMAEIDANLKAHELIKIRVFSDAREQRESYLATICEALAAAPVQHIGKLLIVWRPALPAERKSAKGSGRARSGTRQTKRSMQGSRAKS